MLTGKDLEVFSTSTNYSSFLIGWSIFRVFSHNQQKPTIFAKYRKKPTNSIRVIALLDLHNCCCHTQLYSVIDKYYIFYIHICFMVLPVFWSLLLNSATSLKLIVSNRRVRNPVSVLFTVLLIFIKLLPEAMQSFFASSHVFKVLCL